MYTITSGADGAEDALLLRGVYVIMQDIILHLDMNSFFASCEQQDDLSLRGRPVGVCEHLGGIIIAASIEAKRWGIKTGTPVWEARKLYPKIILKSTSPGRYRLYNRRLVRVVSDYTDFVEVYSIDEVFLDLTRVCNIRSLRGREPFFAPGSFNKDSLSGQINPFWEAVSIAREIKQRMKKEVGDYLTCSVGIAENKLLAKIASDMKKPDGMTVITGSQKQAGWAEGKMPSLGIRSFAKNDLYDLLKLTDVPGIGARMEKNLNALGIFSLKDLRDYPKSRLVARFGIAGFHLYNMGQLSASFRPQVAEEPSEMKSLGHMYTLPREFREKKYFIPVLYKLSEMVAGRLRRCGLAGSILHLHLHDGNHECFGRSKRLGFFMRDGREIFLSSRQIFEASFPKRSLPCLGSGIRLVGVSLSGLRSESGQRSLFGSDEKQKMLTAALDEINSKYGDFAVCRVPVMQAARVIKDSVGFGRIKEMDYG